MVAQEVTRKSGGVEAGIGCGNPAADFVLLVVEPERVKEKNRIKYFITRACSPARPYPRSVFNHCGNIFVLHDLPSRSIGGLHKHIKTTHAFFIAENTITYKNGWWRHFIHSYPAFIPYLTRQINQNRTGLLKSKAIYLTCALP